MSPSLSFQSLLFPLYFLLHKRCPSPLLQLRRERIAERIRALQELVPSVNKVSASSILSFYNTISTLLVFLFTSVEVNVFFIYLIIYKKEKILLWPLKLYHQEKMREIILISANNYNNNNNKEYKSQIEPRFVPSQVRVKSFLRLMVKFLINLIMKKNWGS